MSATATPIADQAAAFHDSSTPSAENEIFATENAARVARGLPGDIAAAGSHFPDAQLLTTHGAETTFTRATGDKPTVVIFYRGAWCPFCNIALRAYNDALTGPLRDLGIELVAISPQVPDGSLTMAEKNDLRFTVLSDPGNSIAAQLGILSPLSADEVSAQKALGLDVGAVNADGSTTLEYPAVCLVDSDGTIRWIDVHVDYTTRTEPAKILEAVRVHFGN